MDWADAIDRNRQALTAILAALFAMLGFHGGAALRRIPRSVHRAVLRVLRPAESAARRLIVIAARGLVAKSGPARPMPAGHTIGWGGGARPIFQIIDPRKRFMFGRRRTGVRLIPRVSMLMSDRDPHLVPFWSTPEPPADPAPPPDDGQIDARRLVRRLEALRLALADVPRQARRLARWRARRETALGFTPSPLRPGRAPGHRREPDHEVDRVLAQCHWLAWEAMKPDTS